jgi:hypothetical protein
MSDNRPPMKMPPLSRRRLLRKVAELGGAALALPALQALPGRAQAQTGGKVARNFLMVTTPNGIDPLQFWPTGGERDFKLSPILEPLAKHRDKLLIVGPQFGSATSRQPTANTGIKISKTPGIHRAWVATTGHSASVPRTPQTGDGLSVRTQHPSVDQLIANKLAAPTRFRSLEFGVRPVGGDVPCIVNFAMDGSPLPRMSDDKTAWQRVFGSLMGAAPVTPGQPDSSMARRAAVSSFLHGRFAALGPSLGKDDRRSLEGHLSSLREVESRIGGSPTPGAGCNIQGMPFKPAAPTDANPTSDAPALFANMQDMVALAFACDLTRVASISMSFEGGGGTAGLFPSWLGFSNNHHSCSHHAGNADKRTKYNQIVQWYALMMARQLDQLKAQPHPAGGTVLDHTVVWWMFRHGDGNAHANFGIPGIIAGGAGGHYGQMGRFLSLPGTELCSMLFSMVNAMGLDIPAFGIAENRVTAPLAALRAA